MPKKTITQVSEKIQFYINVLFAENPSLENFRFLIHYSSHDNACWCSEEDIFINGKHGSDIGDLNILEDYRKIDRARSLIPGNSDCDIVLKEIEKLLSLYWDNFVNSDPLNKIWHSQWGIIQSHIEKDVSLQELLKEAFPWRYISYVEVEMSKNGPPSFIENKK